MLTTRQYVAPLWPPFLLLIFTNIANLIQPLPVLIQLLLNAGLSIHIGALISSALTKVSYQQVKQCEQQMMTGEGDKYSCNNIWKILQFPLIGCVVLLGLYYVLKNSEKIAVDTLFDFIFVVLVVVFGGARVHSAVIWLLEKLEIKNKLSHKLWNLFVKISKFLFCPLLALLSALVYIDTKHWLLNNFFGICLTLGAIKSGGINSFKIIVPILWLLFFYDLFWVYQSDVMVTVAKGINLPLKLQFPYKNLVGQEEYSLLGLGDIIIPGLFLSLCFKYDIDNFIVARSRQKLSQFGMKLYNAGFLLYIVALLMTYMALYVFKHPQPALVFIVPCLTLTFFVNKFFGKRLSLLKYNSSTMAKSEESISV